MIFQKVLFQFVTQLLPAGPDKTIFLPKHQTGNWTLDQNLVFSATSEASSNQGIRKSLKLLLVVKMLCFWGVFSQIYRKRVLFFYRRLP